MKRWPSGQLPRAANSCRLTDDADYLNHEYLAAHSAEFGLVVVPAEDEISAINMTVGAGYTGVRAMTATSGGGFCLMVEGLGWRQ